MNGLLIAAAGLAELSPSEERAFGLSILAPWLLGALALIVVTLLIWVPRPQLHRFSLRALLITMTLAAVVLGLAFVLFRG